MADALYWEYVGCSDIVVCNCGGYVVKKALTVIFCLLLVLTSASAHPGGTDGSGGHWDHSAGEYHYHHGYPAHQHTDGICPYDYDDQTGASSGAPSSESASDSESIDAVPSENQSAVQEQTYDAAAYEPDEPPEGYPNAVNYEIETGSQLIDRTYYFNENGFMYIPWTKENLPHGNTETDNTNFLQFGYPYIGDVIYQYGLENQSRQFQEGATFGLHEAQCYYNQWYQFGYDEGYQTAQSEPISDEEYKDAYDAGYDDGVEYGKKSGHSAGYSEAENKYQLIILIAGAIAIVIVCLLLYALRKVNENLSQCQKKYEDLQQAYTQQCSSFENERSRWNQILQSMRSQASSSQTQFAKQQPEPKASITFGNWPSSIHHSSAQLKRFQNSLDPHLKMLGPAGNCYKVQGTTGIYDVTLTSCNCPDFLINLHGQSPCKHIYFLARQLGIPVTAIFSDYFDVEK